jgi:hypothetical protein
MSFIFVRLSDFTKRRIFMRKVLLITTLTGLILLASFGAGAQAPPPWEHRQNVCDSLPFYSVNPAYNPRAKPTHTLGKYKRLYYTTGPIVKGWVPVYSAGQEHWHTGWVQGQCLVRGWSHPQEGKVIN